MEKKDILPKVLQTLNTIEIKGRENISKMLGCIEAIQHLLTEEEQDANSDDSGPENP